MTTEIVRLLVQFGVAGLMGMLWVWERFMSRQHARQLAESHQYILEQKQELCVLIDLVNKNTKAFEKFDQTQKQLKELLLNINKRI